MRKMNSICSCNYTASLPRQLSAFPKTEFPLGILLPSPHALTQPRSCLQETRFPALRDAHACTLYWAGCWVCDWQSLLKGFALLQWRRGVEGCAGRGVAEDWPTNKLAPKCQHLCRVALLGRGFAGIALAAQLRVSKYPGFPVNVEPSLLMPLTQTPLFLGLQPAKLKATLSWGGLLHSHL